jgi:hypothetical protein
MSRRTKKNDALVRYHESGSRLEVSVASIEIEFTETDGVPVGHLIGRMIAPILSRMFPGMAIPQPIAADEVEVQPREVPAVVESSRNIEEDEEP